MWNNNKRSPVSARYESKHAKDRRSDRGISPDKVDKCIQAPDKRKMTDKGIVEHYKKDSSTGLWTKAILRFGPGLSVGTGVAVIASAPVAGIAVGVGVLILTYYQTNRA